MGIDRFDIVELPADLALFSAGMARIGAISEVLPLKIPLGELLTVALALPAGIGAELDLLAVDHEVGDDELHRAVIHLKIEDAEAIQGDGLIAHLGGKKGLEN